ncbi:MAG: ArsR/SmtB family transcription factor [Planctomycetota bacterium]
MSDIVLSHETRRSILLLLRDGEKTAGAIAEELGRARPGVSHHLACLLDNGLVACRQERAHRFYALDVRTALEAWDEYVRGEDSPES